MRRGISLMEVLISMFILAVGLLGVAALIPAGRHEIVEAAKLDNAAMVGRAAFRDMQVRGFLNPAGWTMDPNNTPDVVYDRVTAPNTPFTAVNSATVSIDPDSARYAAYAIDPLGLTSPAAPFDTMFPAGASLATPMPAPPLMRVAPFSTTGITNAQRYALFDSIFRSSFDQILEPNATNPDFPPTPRWFSGNTRRASDGNYSWIATVVSDPSRLATTGDVTVSVAVFYKRNLSSGGADEVEREVLFTTTPVTSGSSITIRDVPRDAANKLKPLKPGQWIMLGGMKTVAGDPLVNQYNYYRWYKVLAAAAPQDVGAGIFNQGITIAGSDWSCAETDTRAWLFDNIVNVYEKQLPLEVQ